MKDFDEIPIYDDYSELERLLLEEDIDFKANEPLSNHTSFKIGGACRLLIIPCTEGEATKIMSFIQKVQDKNKTKLKSLIIGNGSNILVSDDGYDGAVILFGNNFSDIKLKSETTIMASAGASLMKLCNFAMDHSLSGLEWAYGIPATVGGAVYMNAGAYGGEMVDVVQSVWSIDENTNIVAVSRSELGFSYRHSVFTDTKICILSATFELQKGNKEQIKQLMNQTMNKRLSKQPLEYPSAGSTFKRPPNAFAAKLIEDCGLKGVSVGGAQVSEKHSGFVINKDNASCKDVKELINLVKKTVAEKTNIMLECEVKFV